jgi:hypothetical protein
LPAVWDKDICEFCERTIGRLGQSTLEKNGKLRHILIVSHHVEVLEHVGKVKVENRQRDNVLFDNFNKSCKPDMTLPVPSQSGSEGSKGVRSSRAASSTV